MQPATAQTQPEPQAELAVRSIPLTPYQHRIIQYKLAGLSIFEIQRKEGTARQTIGFHITRAYRKLGIEHPRQLFAAYSAYREKQGLPKLQI